jgi:hypothetical protein
MFSSLSLFAEARALSKSLSLSSSIYPNNQHFAVYSFAAPFPHTHRPPGRKSAGAILIIAIQHSTFGNEIVFSHF